MTRLTPFDMDLPRAPYARVIQVQREAEVALPFVRCCTRYITLSCHTTSSEAKDYTLPINLVPFMDPDPSSPFATQLSIGSSPN